MTDHTTVDLHIESLRGLIPPAILLEEIPLSSADADRVTAHRRAIAEVLHGRDRRMVVVVGPCSIHDPAAALEYAARLRALSAKLENDLLIVMRVYFEKPTRWAGKVLINDPRARRKLTRSTRHSAPRAGLLRRNRALGIARRLRTRSDPPSAIHHGPRGLGARSAPARPKAKCIANYRPASRCPVGFKNGTDGNIRIAVDGVISARHPHCLLG